MTQRDQSLYCGVPFKSTKTISSGAQYVILDEENRTRIGLTQQNSFARYEHTRGINGM
jgi:hypothetical protein